MSDLPTALDVIDFIKSIKMFNHPYLPTSILMHPRDYRQYDMGRRKKLGLGRLPRKKKLERYGRIK